MTVESEECASQQWNAVQWYGMAVESTDGSGLDIQGEKGACWLVSGASFTTDIVFLTGDRVLSVDRAVMVGTNS